jgi:hypothetical protein
VRVSRCPALVSRSSTTPRDCPHSLLMIDHTCVILLSHITNSGCTLARQHFCHPSVEWNDCVLPTRAVRSLCEARCLWKREQAEVVWCAWWRPFLTTACLHQLFHARRSQKSIPACMCILLCRRVQTAAADRHPLQTTDTVSEPLKRLWLVTGSGVS